MKSVSLLVALVAALGPGISAAQSMNFDPKVTYSVPSEGAASLGPDDALVTIVEFSDFYCGFCRRANTTLRQLLQLYPGELRLIYVHTPLDPEEGTLAAEAALAAGAQGQFWPMHDRIFAGPRGAERTLLERYARDLGLDLPRFRADLDTRAHRRELDRQIEMGNQLGVRSTPIFFVNGKPVVGARDLGVFVGVIEEELARARSVVRAGVPKANLYEAIMGTGKEHGTADEVEDRQSLTLEEGERYPVPLGRASHAEGPADALVTIVEFSDFQCPYCRRAAPTVRKLREHFGDKLRVVYRHFPVAGHDHALLAAEAAIEAGAQGKFWPYHDQLLGNQQALNRSDLDSYAEAVGLDMAKFRRAVDDRSHMVAALTEFAEGATLGVRGTPTFFINGVALVGAKPYELFEKAIDAELAYAEKLVAAGVPKSELYKRIVTGEASPEAGGASEPVPSKLDELDYHIAVLVACRGNDRERAAALYKEIKDKARRKMIRSDCKRIGIALP